MARIVLIADSDMQSRIVAGRFLCARGISVRFADHGAEVAEAVQRERIALVVLDLDCPEINGFDLLRRIRGLSEAFPLAYRPCILAVTARGDVAVKRFALRLGADAVVHKPLVAAQFIGAVERLARDDALRPASAGTERGKLGATQGARSISCRHLALTRTSNLALAALDT